MHACRARPLARSTPVRCTRHSLGFSGRQTSSQSSRDGDGSSSSARARERGLAARFGKYTHMPLAERMRMLLLLGNKHLLVWRMSSSCL